MKPRSSVVLFFILVLAGVAGPGAYAQDDTFEQRGTYLARQWMEAFRKLDARNNIVMVLSNRDSYYEIEHVVSIDAHGHFLVVRCESRPDVYYHALVYPSSIMLVKEVPPGAKASQSQAQK